MASKVYRALTITTAFLCTLILGISIAGIVTSRRALDIRNKYRSYTPGGIGNNIYFEDARLRGGPLNPDTITGWYYQTLPRNIRYGNERAVLGCSAAILVLIIFPLLTSAIAKVRPINKTNPSGFPRLNVFLAACSLLVGLVGIIYTQVAISTSDYDFSRFDSSAPEGLTIDQRTAGSTGMFSVESWTCNARDIVTRGQGYQYEDLDNACSDSIAANWLMVALFIATALLAPLCVIVRMQAMKNLREAGVDKTIVLQEREERAAAAKQWWARPGVDKTTELQGREERAAAAKQWWARA